MRGLLQNAAGVGLSIALLLSAPTSCDYGCTAMGCSSSVEIRFDPPITEAGQYTFVLEADGARSTCEVDFDGSDSFPRSSMCSDLLVDGTGPGTSSMPSGGPSAIVGFGLEPAATIAVQVSREGAPWAERRFEPRYQGVEINGPGCGECPMAREEIALP